VTANALVPRPGHAVAEDGADFPQPAFATAVAPNPDGSTTFRPEAALELVFRDSEAASRLRRQAALPLTEPCPFEAMPDVPRVGIVSGTDRLLRPEWLDRVVRERLGVEPTVLDGDHTPMLSQPDRFAELLLAETA
jgi:pimeloyl-ACP methyl ester carboxylesterase